MKTLLRNLKQTFRRFFTAGVLNLLGLSIAFASFFVIMTQVDYDTGFNKGYKDYQNIFRLEIRDHDGNFRLNTPRPMGEMLQTLSPHVKGVGIFNSIKFEQTVKVGENTFTVLYQPYFKGGLTVFQPQILVGNIDQAVIPASMAERIFGTVDAAANQIIKTEEGGNITVSGVYKDFPENTQYGNPIFGKNDDYENEGNWKNFNYCCYVRLDTPQAAPEVLKLLKGKLKSIGSLKRQGDTDRYVRFTPLVDAHFSKVGNLDASSHAMVYLLLCVSFLIVLIAAINYMNFSLAETPMRVRSINTQKVLGANVASLRTSLIAETVIVCVIAFGLSLLWVELLKEQGLQELVEADLTLGKHPILLCVTATIAVVTGILAGAYPAYYVTSFPPALALKGSFGLSPKGRALRTGLVCMQFTVSFVLIVSIGIMYLQSRYIRLSDYGYDKNEIIVGFGNYDSMNQQDAVVSELKTIPGVEEVAFSQFVISSGDSYMSWGRYKGDEYMNFVCMPVNYNYLKTLGIHITEGRDFLPGEQNVYIFNEAARKKYPWLKLDEAPFDFKDVQEKVVGFCENVKFNSFRINNEECPLAFYINPQWGGLWVINVRTAKGVDKVAMIHSLQKTMEKFASYDFGFRFMDQILDGTYQREMRFIHQILLFSFIAILISLIGVFGLTMFESEYRRKEIGIRKIMGSSTGAILYMFNKRYLLILIGCFVVAAPCGWWIGRHWLEGFADRTPIYAWVFIAAFLLVTFITMLTVTIQSWKNANENPVNSIKTE